MKNIVILLGMTSFLAACETPGQTALTGAALGAATGAATAGRDETRGAVIGAAAGLAAGAAVAAAQQGPQCKYIYPDGTEIIDDCP